jgi:dipeptidyl aminopeptidase/acylaminoacyl peptidase
MLTFPMLTLRTRIFLRSGLPFLLTFLLCLFSSDAANAANFTLEQVMSSPFPSNLVAASHSGRVAWVFDAKGVRNLWVADAPNFAARQVTHYEGDDGLAIASLRITADDRTLVYVRGSEANESGRIADPTNAVWSRKQQVWAVEVDAGAPRMLGEMGCGEEECEDVELSPDGQFAVWAARKQLWIAPVTGATPAHQLTDLRGDNSNPRWSPDGRQIALVSQRGDHSFIAVYDFGRDSVRYLAPSSDRDIMPRWSPDGSHIAFVRLPGIQEKLPLIPVRPVPWAIWVADSATGRAKEIWHSGREANDSFPQETAAKSFYFAGNDKLLFASEQDGWNHLYAVSTSGGAPVLLTPGSFEVEDVTLSADRHSVIFSSNQQISNQEDIDRRHLWRINLEGGKPQPLTKGETMEWTPVETGVGNQVVCLGSSATLPAMPVHVTAQGRELLAQAALPADFPSKQLVMPKQVVFKSEDGLEIHGQLFVPAGRNQPGPALIFTHGGPVRQMMLGFHYMYYYHNAYAMNQYLASQGYVVLSVNYRLGIMYGRAFREAANASWRGGAEYKDVVAGARFLQGQPTIDPKKIGLWGGSYGGYLTAMGLAHNSDIFAAGVDFHGVHDWSVFLPRWENRPGAPDTKEAEKLAFESSPDAAVSSWKSPVLLIHGDDDRNVPFGQTVDLAQRLREQNVVLEELIFPDEVHDFLMWKNWIKAYGATADFFDRNLKGTSAQPGR